MIKLAFCDDDLTALRDLSALLDRYREERDCGMTCTAYRSPLELMADLERGHRWDILLLDILMPGENGVELAQEVRKRDDQVKIIFLTSSPEFAVEAYAVWATYYQLKPINEGNLFPVLDRVIASCQSERRECLLLKCKTGLTALHPEKLEYCEIMGHNLLLHMSDGTVLESTGSLDELEENLCPLGGFLRVHRSYLVNMDRIQSISYRAVTMESQREIPLPRGKYSEVKRIYLAHALEKDRVMT